MSEEPVLNAGIYRKLVAVCKDVTYIQKDKRNSFHGYNYASEAAIKDRLHEAFATHGLVMLPPEMLSINDVEQMTEKGKRETVTTIQIRFGIADIESGESVSGTVYGRGVDSSDKGVYKAITGGLKYFLTSTFLIPTGDDPEQQEEQPAKAAQKPQAKAVTDAITEAQIKRMFAIATKAGLSTTQAKQIVGNFGYESSKEIKGRDYDAICKEMESSGLRCIDNGTAGATDGHA